MGTRADFYVGNDPATMEWLGSIAYDGYSLHGGPHDMHDAAIASATTKKAFRQAVKRMLKQYDHATFPENGWPWPWEDSRTTDYAYCFVGAKVLCYMFGHGPVDIGKPFCNKNTGDFYKRIHEKAEFPDMTARQNVTLGKRSGVLFVSEG